MFKNAPVWKLSIYWEHNAHQMKATFIKKRKCLHDGYWILNRFFTNEDSKQVHLYTPIKFFKNFKKIFGKIFAIQKVILQWSCAFSLIKYWYLGKFLSKKIVLLTFGLWTLILETEEGRAEKLAKKINKLKSIHKNWAIFQTCNAYEMKVHLVVFKMIYH